MLVGNTDLSLLWHVKKVLEQFFCPIYEYQAVAWQAGPCILLSEGSTGLFCSSSGLSEQPGDVLYRGRTRLEEGQGRLSEWYLGLVRFWCLPLEDAGAGLLNGSAKGCQIVSNG